MKPCAVAVVFDTHKTKVLLHKRQDVPVWVLPGGGIDSHETAEEAAVREVLEETGLEVAISRQVAEYTPLNRLTRPTYSYECQVIDGNLTLGSETADVAFFPLDQLPKMLFPLHHIWIADALKDLPSVIQAPITQITYWSLLLEILVHPCLVARYFITRFFKM